MNNIYEMLLIILIKYIYCEKKIIKIMNYDLLKKIFRLLSLL